MLSLFWWNQSNNISDLQIHIHTFLCENYTLYIGSWEFSISQPRKNSFQAAHRVQRKSPQCSKNILFLIREELGKKTLTPIVIIYLFSHEYFSLFSHNYLGYDLIIQIFWLTRQTLSHLVVCFFFILVVRLQKQIEQI